MVEVEGGGVSFIEFRFVPFLRDENASETEEGDEEE
jgi:cell cycle checkpoint protein